MRKWYHRSRQISMILFSLVLFVSVIPLKANAIEPIDENAQVALTIDYQGENGPVTEAVFHLYKVAEVEGYGTFTPTEVFEKYALDYENQDTAGWKSLAETLSAYISRDMLLSMDTGITDREGQIHFPQGKNRMTPGLYLVIGETSTVEHKVYSPEPILICLPNRDAEDEWQYTETISPKYITDLEMTKVQVLKVWKDEGNEKQRPKNVEIQLLKGKVIQDTIELNKDNNWRYTWENLEAGADWKVVEKKVTDGYTVKIEQKGSIFTVTNTYKEQGKIPNQPTLPQTGMLWWPIPILAISGMILFVIGWIRHQKD